MLLLAKKSVKYGFTFASRINDSGEAFLTGSIPNTLTLEEIRCGNSAPRNVFLVKSLDNLRYFDGLRRGIPMMLEAMQERTRLENIGDLFRLT